MCYYIIARGYNARVGNPYLSRHTLTPCILQKGSENMEMEVVNVVTNTISNVGFPIVCVGALGYLFYREQELHKQESKLFADAINNLTLTLTKIAERLGEESAQNN